MSREQKKTRLEMVPPLLLWVIGHRRVAVPLLCVHGYWRIGVARWLLGAARVVVLAVFGWALGGTGILDFGCKRETQSAPERTSFRGN